MAVEYTLWMQKTKNGSPVKSSLDDFGFVACAITWPDEETQDVATRTWVGENGEDIYISPDGLTLKAYDLSVTFCYKGEVGSAYGAYKAFRNYLTGIDSSGGQLKIYDPYWKKGRTEVYIKKFGNLTPHRSNLDEVLSVQVTFRVADPITEIVAGINTEGEITSLGVV